MSWAPHYGEDNLALSPNDGETFLKEVDEELRKEQVNSFVTRYGWWILGAVVLLLAAIAGWIWWQARQQASARGPQGETLIEALGEHRGGNRRRRRAQDRRARAEATARAIAPPPCSPAPTAETAAGNVPAAIATLRAIADDQALDETYRQAAPIRQTALEFDTLPPQEVIRRLGPLTESGSAWLGSRRRDGRRRLSEDEPPRSRRPGLRRASAATRTACPIRSRRAPLRWPRSLGIDVSAEPAARNAAPARPAAPAAPPAPAPATREKARMKRIVLALAAIGLLVRLRNPSRHAPARPRRPSATRIRVLGTESQIEADPLLAAIPVTVPAPAANTDWAQPGGNASKTMGHVALGDSPTPGVERLDRHRQQLPHPAGLRAGGRRRPRLHDRHASRGCAPSTSRPAPTIWEHQAARREQPARGACSAAASPSTTAGSTRPTAPATRPRSTRATGNQYLDGEAGRAAARRADRRRRHRLHAERRTASSTRSTPPTANRAGRAPARSSWPACSAAPPRLSPNRPSSPAIASGELTAYRYENGQVVWQDALARTGISTSGRHSFPTSTPIR